jgi:hypothetical protein
MMDFTITSVISCSSLNRHAGRHLSKQDSVRCSFIGTERAEKYATLRRRQSKLSGYSNGVVIPTHAMKAGGLMDYSSNHSQLLCSVVASGHRHARPLYHRRNRPRFLWKERLGVF